LRIVVTGGAGYIGSVTTRLLLDAGHEVTVLDSLERGHRGAVDPRATLVHGDVGDAELLYATLPGHDAVMHLAGLIEVAESQEQPDRYLDYNVQRPTELLDAMERADIQPIVFSSTAAVYGEPEVVPIPEDAPTRPVNVYGETKLRFEEILADREQDGRLEAIRLRYFNVAGAWPDGAIGEAHQPETHIIPRILKAMADGQEAFEVFGGDYPTPDGTCVRDYLHVWDLAQAHRIALERLVAGGKSGVFNLGNGAGFSNLEVVRTCAEVTGRDVRIDIGPRRQGDPARLVASNARALAELGWQPQRGELRMIIEDAWRWHRGHPEGYADAAAFGFARGAS
jgi:UDP-glucose 4-epimerase